MTQSPLQNRFTTSSGTRSSRSAFLPNSYVVDRTSVTSSALSSENSSRYTSPTFGLARKMMPGLSPSRPALKEPSLFTSSSFFGSSPSKVSNSAVSSPQYQVAPSFADAYQSLVSSVVKPSTVTRSFTTMQR